jgi:capsular polysaccharide biosynthesis protein
MRKNSPRAAARPIAEPAVTATATESIFEAPLTRPTAADEVLEAIRRRWPLIVAIALATALLAWLFASMQSKRYRASAIAAVTPIVMEEGDQIRGVQTLDQRTFVASIAALAATPVVEHGAVPSHLSGYAIRAVVLPSTTLLRIDVDGQDGAQAANIANRVPTLLAAQAKSIFHIYDVKLISPAASGELIFPRVQRIIAAGMVIGLFLGTAVAWAKTRARDGDVRRPAGMRAAVQSRS